MHYCISDIHGDYSRYCGMLDRIGLSEEDTLYVLGDVVDRGGQPVELLLDIMERPNVVPLLGNHEYMFACCLAFLMKEVTEQNLSALHAEDLCSFLHWQSQGGAPTLEGFRRLSPDQRQAVREYLGEFSLYEEVEAGGQSYLLTHAGPDHFSPRRPLGDYALHELLWTRLDYSKVYYRDRFLVTGHTPTRNIPENPAPDRIYQANRHIAIDCGCGHGGHLGCLCLDTLEEFYV